MPVILIQNASGESEIRELSKQFPIAIGRHASNDLQIQDSGVEILHCRISWNSRGFEAVAAGPHGLTVNGQKCPTALLTLGDCIQVGNTGIFYYDQRSQAEAALRGEPVEESVPVASEDHDQTEDRSGSRSQKSWVAPPPPLPPPAPLSRNRTIPVKVPVPAEDEEPDEPEEAPEPLVAAPHATGQSAASIKYLDLKARRPGEQELLRSPLIISLSIFTTILVLVAIALWVVIGRDASAKSYQLAVTEMEQKRFGPAISQFENFLKQYPSHKYASTARHAIGQCLIEQPITGAAPDYAKGMTALEEYVLKERRAKDFPDMLPKVLDLALRIAKGSADAAGIQKKPELLKVSENSTRLLQQYSPPDKPPTQALEEIDASVQKAQSAIRKHTTFQLALGEMDRELKANHPFAAFESRRKLLLQYSDLANDKGLQERVASALKIEKALASRRLVDQPAETGETPQQPALPALTLLRQTRTRSDSIPSGTNVFTMTDTTCFAVDSVTGNPQWKRFLGPNPVFPPQPLALDVLSVLVFDSRTSELLLLKQRDGGLVWRQKLPAQASAAPLVHEGQIFIPTQSGILCQLDAVTGKLAAQLSFSQPLASTPILIANGERLLMIGDRAVLYTLNYRPLECLAVTYAGHSAGSIQAPPLRMGGFVLTCENDRQDSARLRVWDASKLDQPLTELVTSRIPGTMRDPAVLRGKQLIVPSSPERLSAFTVSDERGEKVLSSVASYQAEKPLGGPIFVTLGPDDELWMTSSALRRLKLGADSLIPDAGQLNLGITSLPAQVQNQSLFATSRLKSSSGTFLLAADRQQMVTQWLLALGGRALRSGAPAPDGSIPLFVDTGDVYSLTAGKLNAGGFDNRPVTSLVLPAGLTRPPEVTTLSNGRLAVWCREPQPKLWQLNQDGVITRESALPGELEAPPITLSGGILLPLKSKLRLIDAVGFNKPVEDLMPPIDPKHPSRWKSILALDEKQFIAVNDQGRVLRGQVRSEPVPHVAEVASIELKAHVDFAPILLNNRLYVATDKILHCLDGTTLERRANLTLPASISQGPWSIGTHLMVVCGTDRLISLNAEPPCQQEWEHKLEHGPLVGVPLARDSDLLEATLSGRIQLRRATDGTVIKSLDVGQTLVYGPFLVQDRIVVATRDSSLLVLNSWLETLP